MTPVLQLRYRPLALCLAALLTAPAAPAFATTIPVTSCADAGVGSLRDAIGAAVSGDTIDFDANLACSTITLTSGAIVISTGADGMPLTHLEIIGPGRSVLAIDGNYTDRVFAHQAGPDGSLLLTNIALHHGFTGGDGGCVYSEGTVDIAYAELSECAAGVAMLASTPSGNTGARGGALAAHADVLISHSFVGDSKVDGRSGNAYGGGVWAVHNLDIDRSTISGNFATSDTGGTYGGGVAVGDRNSVRQGTLILNQSDLQNNGATSHCGSCPARGGGAFVYGNTSTALSSISGNSAFSDAHYGFGGGLYFGASSKGAPVGAAIVDSNVGSNSSDNNGGAIGAGGDLQIIGSTLSGNSARSGGAVLQLSGQLFMLDSLMTGNIAMADGGAVWQFSYGDVTVENSTISENFAQGNGGAIANSYGSVHLANATVTGNTANAQGGGIWFEYPYYTLAIESTIVAGNTVGSDAGDIFAPGATVEGSHDLIVAAPGVALPADTIAADPMLVALADNGGATMTHALAEGSPAIDAGSNLQGFVQDQRGSGFPRVSGVAPDIGAFELQVGDPEDPIFASGFDL